MWKDSFLLPNRTPLLSLVTTLLPSTTRLGLIMAVSQSSSQFSRHILYNVPNVPVLCPQPCTLQKCEEESSVRCPFVRCRSMSLKSTFWAKGYSCYQTEKQLVWPSAKKKSVKTLLKAQNSWTLWPNWSWEIKCISDSQSSPLRHLVRGAEMDFKVPSQLLRP